MIQKITSLLLFTFLFSTASSAQPAEGCDGIRYFQEVFSDFEKTTLQYGQNINPQGNMQQLWMDVYEPANDQQSKRPLVVLAFGGAFVAGDRTTMTEYCIDFAKRGYVAASIDYRLWNILQQGVPDSSEMLDTAIKAVGDMKAAIRHFRMDAATINQFRVDTNFIFAGGISAGAVAALHSAYLQSTDDIPNYIQTIVDENGGLEGDSGDAANLSYSSKVHAVLNMSGALHRSDWMDADDPPLASYHGTFDEVVPFYKGRAKVFGFEFMTLEGSGNLKQRADLLGIPNLLVEAPGAGHEDAYTSAVYQPYFDEFHDKYLHFFHELVCDGLMVDVKEEPASLPGVEIFPNPATEALHISFSQVGEPLNVMVFDNLGRVVWQQQRAGETAIELHKRDIGKGIYWLQVRAKKGEKYIEKVIFH